MAQRDSNHVNMFLSQQTMALIEPSNNPSEAFVIQMIGQLQLHEDMVAAADVEKDERHVMTDTFRILHHYLWVSDRDDALAKKTASLTFCAVAPQELSAMLARKRKGPLCDHGTLVCAAASSGEGQVWWMSFVSGVIY